ncbi:hypothetical protein C2E23DRAFT_888130 [Lenzites betulinus]|nr:hypothetical protein C2E23DRAFT_888130 [Lenzites betulinus]
MVYVRSRKFCLCLPVRFGVFCESILGMAVGGLFAVGAWLQIHNYMKGTVNPPFASNEKTALWVLAIISTIYFLASLLGLVGAIGRLRGLVTFYASVITLATIADVAGGIYVIYQLFHGEGAADEAKCEKDQAAISADFTHFACNASFKTLRTIVIVLWVAFWIFTIYGCGIAFEYVGQLKEEQELRDDEKRAPPVQNVTYASYGPTTVAPYPFTSAPNAGGQL